jgi:hypothetical protein
MPCRCGVRKCARRASDSIELLIHSRRRKRNTLHLSWQTGFGVKSWCFALFHFLGITQIAIFHSAATAFFAEVTGRLNQFYKGFGVGINVTLLLESTKGFIFSIAHFFIFSYFHLFDIYFSGISSDDILFDAVIIQTDGLIRLATAGVDWTQDSLTIFVFCQNVFCIIVAAHLIALHLNLAHLSF